MANQIISHRYWLAKQVSEHKDKDVPVLINLSQEFEREKIIPFIRFSKAIQKLGAAIVSAFLFRGLQ